MFKKLISRFKKPKQYTFVYCPKCNNELVSNGRFIEDNDGIVKYRCSRCGNVSFWDFAHFPVPYLRTCGDCAYLYFNNDGSSFCICEETGSCSPAEQICFRQKRS